jgi:predicted DsbA family dithiol-disulfide isomerase
MELAISPNEMIEPKSSDWTSYCGVVDELAKESGLMVPRVDFIPWTRKAHELAIHAANSGAGQRIADSLFRAHFDENRDVGRVDVLTQIAHESGLDLTEARAVLDVDKYAEEMTSRATAALRVGVDRVPTVRYGHLSLVGPVGIHDLRTLFESPGGFTAGT